MKIHQVVAFASGVALATTIAYRPRQIIDICNLIFNNAIAKSTGLGLGLGVAITAVLILRARRRPPGVQTHTGMISNFFEGLVILGGPPIIGTVTGALVGVVLFGSRHVTIGIK